MRNLLWAGLGRKICRACRQWYLCAGVVWSRKWYYWVDWIGDWIVATGNVRSSYRENPSPASRCSARQVQQAVKQWKEAKSKEVSETVANEFNLFTGEDEVVEQSQKSFTDEENRGVELEKKRAETQKLLDEISMMIQTAADKKLEETIRELKSIRDVLNARC